LLYFSEMTKLLSSSSDSEGVGIYLRGVVHDSPHHSGAQLTTLITTMGIITAVSSTADLVDNINNNNMSILDCGKQRKTNCEQVKKGRKESLNGSVTQTIQFRWIS
jgi:hypothetical protein